MTLDKFLILIKKELVIYFALGVTAHWIVALIFSAQQTHNIKVKIALLAKLRNMHIHRFVIIV